MRPEENTPSVEGPDLLGVLLVGAIVVVFVLLVGATLDWTVTGAPGLESAPDPAGNLPF
jgi:hypothetical protein